MSGFGFFLIGFGLMLLIMPTLVWLIEAAQDVLDRRAAQHALDSIDRRTQARQREFEARLEKLKGWK